MVQETRAGREEIASSKELITQRQRELEEAQQRLNEARQQHLKNLASFLGTSEESSLAFRAEEIISLADRENLNPQTLFQTLSNLAWQVTLHSEFHMHNPMPEPQNEEDYFKQAIEFIKQDGYGAKATMFQSSRYLDEAIKRGEERGSSRLVLYKWARENLSLLYDIQKKNWWAHY